MFTMSEDRPTLHSFDLPETWGSAGQLLGERIRLGLDVADREPYLCIDYLPNGRVASGTVSLDMEESPQLALAILRLASVARGCSTSDLLGELLDGERRQQ